MNALDGALRKALVPVYPTIEPVTLDDYKETLCPMFDRAYSALLEDLRQRGLLETTLVVAMGEFGRTPHINPRGGRDHWPSCWSVLFAGSGVRGGQVIGESDSIGAEPKDKNAADSIDVQEPPPKQAAAPRAWRPCPWSSTRIS